MSRSLDDTDPTVGPQITTTTGRRVIDQPPITQQALTIYFEKCHRQPVWCFNREDIADLSDMNPGLGWALLALTAHFTPAKRGLRSYLETAVRCIMQCIGEGASSICTLEALCLIAYAFVLGTIKTLTSVSPQMLIGYLDHDVRRGRFHIGLGLELCKMAALDDPATYAAEDVFLERKKRVFWSLQLLEHFHGSRSSFLSLPSQTWEPSEPESYDAVEVSGHIKPQAPPMPAADETETLLPAKHIWNFTVQLGWMWTMTRSFVMELTTGSSKEPWKSDSTYAQILSHLMSVECRVPMNHRYQSVKFFAQNSQSLQQSRQYWCSWLIVQLTYHCVHTVVNHPFLYVAASQQNRKLAAINTFWTRSSKLVLRHATWIVHMIDIIMSRHLELVDPMFGHVAAIAATVHLHYCCSATPRLQQNSVAYLTKCRRFLRTFTGHSKSCALLASPKAEQPTVHDC